MDDGSTDATAEVARRFVSRGVTVLSRKNGGLSAGQNYAYAHSQGEYIQFLDADDILAPNKIERQLAALRKTDSKRLLLSSPWAPFLLSDPPCSVCAQLAVPGSFSCRVAFEEDGRRPPHAKRHLAGEPGVG